MWLDCFRYCPRCGSLHFNVNDERSRRCLDCGFVYYLNASGAYVAFITNERGELLVVRRKKEPALGTLDLPGGFADPDETAEQGVAREVLEETGLVVTSTRYLFSVPNRYEYSGMAIPTLDLFFACEVENINEVRAGDDAAEVMWLHRKDIDPSLFGLHSISQGVDKYLKLLI